MGQLSGALTESLAAVGLGERSARGSPAGKKKEGEDGEDEAMAEEPSSPRSKMTPEDGAFVRQIMMASCNARGGCLTHALKISRKVWSGAMQM